TKAKFDVTSNIQRQFEELGWSVNASYNGYITSAALSASGLTTQDQQSTSLALIAHITSTFEAEEVAKTAHPSTQYQLNSEEGPKDFFARCGRWFISQVKRGIRVAFVIEIMQSDSERSSTTSLSANGSYYNAQLNAHFWQTFRTAASENRFIVRFESM